MSQFTNFGENKLIDKLRGVEPTYAAAWYIAFASAADDGTFTELTNTGLLTRATIVRSLANWAGTQGAGTTLASTGTTHTTSNNVDIQFSTASGDLPAPATHIGFFDASTGGNCWIWFPLANPITVNNTDTPVILAGAVVLSLGLTGGCTDYIANKLIDEIFRAEAYPWPANTYAAMYTAAPTNAGGGTEVSGGSYARVSLASSMAALSGTQAAGSTTASSGTSGRSSNNAAVTFPVPTGSWGTVVAAGQKDASTSGNLLFWKALASPKTVSAGGSAPNYAPNAMGFTFD